MEARACYPLGFDPDGDDAAPVCSARSPGPLGLFDAGDPDATAVRGGGLGSLGVIDGAAGLAEGSTWRMPVGQRPGGAVEAGVDEVFLVVAAEAKDAGAPRAGSVTTTAENLGKFSFGAWASWPAPQLGAVAGELRAFGAERFSVHAEDGGAAGLARCLIWRGDPRAADRWRGLRQMIRGEGPHGLNNVRVAHLAVGTRKALRAGLAGTVVSLVLAAPPRAVRALFGDEVTLRRLGLAPEAETAALLMTGPGAGEGERAGVTTAAGAAHTTAVMVVDPRQRGDAFARGDGRDPTLRGLLARLRWAAHHPDAIAGG